MDLSTIGVGKEEIYYSNGGLSPTILYIVEIIAALGVLLGCIAVILYLRNASSSWRRKYLSVMLALWAIGPPAWFCIEYFFLYKPYGPAGTFEAFKYGQDVASKFWLAFVGLLAVVRRNGSDC
jgi:hypothetical protein